MSDHHAFFERLALFVVVLRVLMMIAWGPIGMASPKLASLQLSRLAEMLVATVCVFILSVCGKRWEFFRCLVFALGAAVIYLSATNTGTNFLLIDLLLLFAVSFVEPRRLCRVYAIAALASIIAVMLLSAMRVMPM